MNMLLIKSKPGKVYKVLSLNGSDKTNQFLKNIGLHVGDDITIISKLASNYIINIKDGRFGIDSRMAKLIEVQEC
jgi:ferrous iron transport protein A